MLPEMQHVEAYLHSTVSVAIPTSDKRMVQFQKKRMKREKTTQTEARLGIGHFPSSNDDDHHLSIFRDTSGNKRMLTLQPAEWFWARKTIMKLSE